MTKMESLEFDPAAYKFTDAASTDDLDDLHLRMIHAAAVLDTGATTPRAAVVVGDKTGWVTAPFIAAINQGKLHNLYIFERHPGDELLRVVNSCEFTGRVKYCTRPFRDTDVADVDLVLVNGDPQWEAISDTFKALALGAGVIIITRHRAWPINEKLWGPSTGATLLKQHRGRSHFEDAIRREKSETHRGLFISAKKEVDLEPVRRLAAS